MLGHGGLREAERRRDIADGALAGGEIDQDVPASGFGDGVESV
jgi:hypothetical protein